LLDHFCSFIFSFTFLPRLHQSKTPRHPLLRRTGKPRPGSESQAPHISRTTRPPHTVTLAHTRYSRPIPTDDRHCAVAIILSGGTVSDLPEELTEITTKTLSDYNLYAQSCRPNLRQVAGSRLNHQAPALLSMVSESHRVQTVISSPRQRSPRLSTILSLQRRSQGRMRSSATTTNDAIVKFRR
jgi:hypothetical protein